MKIAVTTYSFINSALKSDSIIDICHRVGVAGIEWFDAHVDNPKIIAKRCENMNIENACYTCTFPEIIPASKIPLNINRLKRQVDIAKTLGSSLFMVYTPNSHPNRDYSRDQWIEALTTICRYTLEVGLTLCIENFPGIQSPFLDSNDFALAHSNISELYLALDTGNCLPAENPVDCYCRFNKSVVHVHCKDVKCQGKQTLNSHKMINGNYYSVVPTGEGDVDYRRLFTLLKNHGYNGYLTIEYDGLNSSNLNLFMRCKEYIEELWMEIE